MAAEWPEMAFPDVIDFQEGPGILATDFREEGVPLVRLAGLDQGGSVLAGCNFLDPEMAAKRWSHFALAEGDILLSSSASLGRIAVVGRDGVGAIPYTGIIRMRPGDHRILAPFLRYLLEGPDFQRQAEIVGVGSVIRHFGPMHLREMTVRLPSRDEQAAVSSILAALDEKMAMNRRMGETLNSMARVLFESWFIRFEPVRAIAEGRPTGLSDEIGRMFPNSFEASPYGDVPKGWVYRPLGELVSLTRGRTYKGGLKGFPGPVLLGLASIRRNGGFRDDNLSTYGGDSPEDLLLGPGELFASLKDVTQSADLLGAVARVPSYVKSGRLTQDTVKLGLKSASTSRSILYRCLLTDAYRAYCRAHATGTTNLGLSRDDFLAFPIPQPPEAVARLYDSINLSFEARMALLVEESRTLAAIRDLLLPKLVSGQLRVDPIRIRQHLRSPA